MTDRSAGRTLVYCVWFWFALKTRDEVSNWSAMSNVVKIRTCVGGGGAMASSGGSEGGSDGMVLGAPLPGDPATDRLVLGGASAGGALAARLVQPPGGTTRLDAVQVLAVDHAPGERVFTTTTGILVGTRRAVARAWRPTGEDLPPLLAGSEGRGLSFKAGDTLFVSLGAPPAGVARAGVAIEASASGIHPEASLGIRVEAIGDSTRAQLWPHVIASVAAVATTADSVRLVFRSPHRVRRISAVDAASAAPTVTTITPSSALHSRLGEVVSQLAPSDTLSATLAAGDTLRLSFLSGSPAQGLVRDHVLVAQGRTSQTTGANESTTSQEISAVPERFALYQNQPNPFGELTTIHFDLPVAAEARLEIFDVAGRRVRTVRTGPLPPGTHALVWDRRDGDGRAVRPGIYLYRIHAGSFADRRRMVLVP